MELLEISEINKKRLRGDATEVAKRLNITMRIALVSLQRPTCKRYNEVLQCFSQVIKEREASISVKINEAESLCAMLYQFLTFMKDCQNGRRDAQMQMLAKIKKELVPTLEAIGNNMKGSYLVGREND